MHLRSRLLLLLFATLGFLSAQDTLTYAPPLKGPLLVTGTFGELRSDHFHAGLDFRGKVGTPVYAVADGYVSRVLISPGGYGQAIYIDHPDGHRSVYAHLEVLAPELKDTVRARQFAEESFRQDLHFGPGVFPVQQGQEIGGVGNRGHSFGPHLHFELREIVGDAPVNPLKFGFNIPDTRRPQLRKLRVYELDDRGLETATQTFSLLATRDGNYRIKDTITVGSRRIGLALKTYDRQNAMPNWNGIYGGELYADSTLIYDFRFDRVPFEKTEYLNAMTDYADWVSNTSWYHRFWALTNQDYAARPAGSAASQYNGIVKLAVGAALPVQLRVLDQAGNSSTLSVVLTYQPGTNAKGGGRPHQYFLPAGEPSIIDQETFRLELDEDALYRDCYFEYARLPDASTGRISDTHQLHQKNTPLHGSARLSITPNITVPERLRPHVFLGSCDDKGHWHANGGSWTSEQRFAANIPTFGRYGLFLDTIPPTVEINAFRTDLRYAQGFSLLMKDNVSGGRLSYRGTIDGQWVLLELDAKSDKLTYNFADGDPGPGEHVFSITVQDARNNTTTWSRKFRR
ncbi:MAG: M23 family metallopeptidase [Bacteroidota bacterium]